jgi:predicted small secreted protein
MRPPFEIFIAYTTNSQRGREATDMKANTQKKRSHLRLALAFLAAALFSIAATGCHTIHGVGRDVEETGQHIERAAR